MPLKIEVTLPRRFWRPWQQRYRRDLPASWTEVEPSRRLPLLRCLFNYRGALGRLKAMRLLLDLPKRIFLGLQDDDLAALIDATAWLDVQPSPEPVLPSFVHQGITYHAPLGHGLNLVALEYPIADEAFGKFIDKADPAALRLLVATLYREANTDENAVIQRGDIRVPLRTRWEAEHRAKKFAGLDTAVAQAVLLYFAGVKLYIHKAYGNHLFEQRDEDEQETTPSTTPSLGWWGVYFNLAQDGPFGRNVEEVYQTSFHDVCLFLVDRKRQDDRMKLQERMKQPDFGINSP